MIPNLQRRRFLGMILAAGLRPTGLQAAGKTAVPAYLADHADLFRSNPHAAAISWFRDAKFGLFVHYALASLLEGGKPEYLELTKGLEDEIELNKLPTGHAARTGTDSLGKLDKVHEGLMKRFRAERFDAGAIADLAVAARMRYLTFTTKHLGRLALYKTSSTEFNSVNAPAGRDLVREMADACAARKLGLFLYVPPETARTDGPLWERNRVILREFLTNYGPIAGIWFDGISGFSKQPENYTRLPELFALIRQLQPQCLVSFKEGAIGQEDFTSPEHFHLGSETTWDTPQRQARWDIRRERWNRLYTERWEQLFKDKPVEINTTMQECLGRDGVGAPGGWINDEKARHLSADEVFYLLRKARQSDCNLLMNIGPRGDGSIHPADAKTLREVGRRNQTHGFPS